MNENDFDNGWTAGWDAFQGKADKLVDKWEARAKQARDDGDNRRASAYGQAAQDLREVKEGARRPMPAIHADEIDQAARDLHAWNIDGALPARFVLHDVAGPDDDRDPYEVLVEKVVQLLGIEVRP